MRDREDAGGPRLNELPAEQRREVVGNVLKQYIGPGDNLVAGESRDAADARTPRERLPVRVHQRAVYAPRRPARPAATCTASASTTSPARSSCRRGWTPTSAAARSPRRWTISPRRTPRGGAAASRRPRSSTTQRARGSTRQPAGAQNQDNFTSEAPALTGSTLNGRRRQSAGRQRGQARAGPAGRRHQAAKPHQAAGRPRAADNHPARAQGEPAEPGSTHSGRRHRHPEREERDFTLEDRASRAPARKRRAAVPPRTPVTRDPT